MKRVISGHYLLSNYIINNIIFILNKCYPHVHSIHLHINEWSFLLHLSHFTIAAITQIPSSLSLKLMFFINTRTFRLLHCSWQSLAVMLWNLILAEEKDRRQWGICRDQLRGYNSDTEAVVLLCSLTPLKSSSRSQESVSVCQSDQHFTPAWRHMEASSESKHCLLQTHKL